MAPIVICGTHHRTSFGMPQVEYEVLVEGVKYRCDDRALDMLEDGICLDEIDLVLIDEVDDD